MNDQRGYILCDVQRDSWATELKVLDTVERSGGVLSTRKKFVVPSGKSILTDA